MRTDRLEDVTDLIGAFRDYAKHCHTNKVSVYSWISTKLLNTNTYISCTLYENVAKVLGKLLSFIELYYRKLYIDKRCRLKASIWNEFTYYIYIYIYIYKSITVIPTKAH
jgi:hypothetical protein